MSENPGGGRTVYAEHSTGRQLAQTIPVMHLESHSACLYRQVPRDALSDRRVARERSPIWEDIHRPVQVPKAQIAKRDEAKVSLMPPGLLDGYSQADISNLLAFVMAPPPAK